MLMLHGLLDNLDLRSLSEEGGYGVDDYPLLEKKNGLRKFRRERWKAVLKKLKLE
jgi:hypothetical protein